MLIDPMPVIRQFYEPGSELYNTLVNHSRIVADLSLKIAKHLPAGLDPDIEFLRTAAMLHDIGIFQTQAASIGCSGTQPYIRHGVLGRKVLDAAGLPEAYGLVCERHTGAGISKRNIVENSLPLPHRDLIPIRLEEKIICIADKYHSKSPQITETLLTTNQVIRKLAGIDPSHSRRFEGWVRDFQIRKIMG